MAHEPSVERRLAAILAADVVGYSKLIGEDEAGTLAALREIRKEIVNPILTKHESIATATASYLPGLPGPAPPRAGFRVSGFSSSANYARGIAPITGNPSRIVGER